MQIRDRLAFLENIDWESNVTDLPNGCRSYLIDCPARSVPFTVPVVSAFEGSTSIKSDARAVDMSDVDMSGVVPLDQRVIDDDGSGILLEPDQSGDTGHDDETPIDQLDRPALLAGISSSTSVDFFGTEMSLRALKLMAVQMMRGSGMNVGVPYIPRHNRGADAIEWDEVIGRTVHAEVVPAEVVANAANMQEPQFVLRTTIRLIPVPKDPAERDAAEQLAATLIKRLKRGEAIGQSIGGWFTRLEMIENEKGDIERIIVHGVDLDHLAVTRAPANPDAVGLVQLRSRAAELIAQSRSTPRAPVDRHAISAKETENTVIYQFLKAGADAGDVEPDEMLSYDEEEKRETSPEAVDLSDVMDELSASDDAPETLAADDTETEHDATKNQDSATTEENQPVSNEIGNDEESLSADFDNSEDSNLSRGPVESDTIRSEDARRSAPGHTISEETENSTMSEERDMSFTVDELRALLDEKLAPLSERIDAIEQRSAPKETAEETVTVDPRIAKLEAERDALLARAEHAERAAVSMAGSSHRVGRSAAGLSVGGPMGAASVYDSVIDRSKSDAPMLARACTGAKKYLLGKSGDLNRHATRGELTETLRSLCNMAEQDGVITPPSQRIAWQ